MLRREFLKYSGGLLTAAALPAIVLPPRVVLPRPASRFSAFDRIVRHEEFPAMQAADEIQIVQCEVFLPQELRLAGKRGLLLHSRFYCDRGGLDWEGALGHVGACAAWGMTCELPCGIYDPSRKSTIVYSCTFVSMWSETLPSSFAEAHPLLQGPEDFNPAGGPVPIGTGFLRPLL